MKESDYVSRHDLGDVVAQVAVRDCRLTYRRQRGTGDVWCVVSGPRGVMANEVIPADVLQRVRAYRDPADPLMLRARGRHAKLPQVRIDEDLRIAVRARGDLLEWHTMFGDGTPFGGGGGWLPTARRPSFLERAQLWLSGHRGSVVSFTRQVEPGLRKRDD